MNLKSCAPNSFGHTCSTLKLPFSPTISVSPVTQLFRIAAPPVDSVGNDDAQIVEAHRIIAASSITNNDKPSERPASSVVGIDAMKEPLENSISVTVPYSLALPFTILVLRCGGRFLYMYLIFLSTFLAVESLMDTMFIFLSGWNIANHKQYMAINSVMPACRNLRMILNRLIRKLYNTDIW